MENFVQYLRKGNRKVYYKELIKQEDGSYRLSDKIDDDHLISGIMIGGVRKNSTNLTAVEQMLCTGVMSINLLQDSQFHNLDRDLVIMSESLLNVNFNEGCDEVGVILERIESLQSDVGSINGKVNLNYNLTNIVYGLVKETEETEDGGTTAIIKSAVSSSHTTAYSASQSHWDGYGWVPAYGDPNKYLHITLEHPVNLEGLWLKGDYKGSYWCTLIDVSYLTDSGFWVILKDIKANVDGVTPVYIKIPARNVSQIKIHPKAWPGRNPAIRLKIYST